MLREPVSASMSPARQVLTIMLVTSVRCADRWRNSAELGPPRGHLADGPRSDVPEVACPRLVPGRVPGSAPPRRDSPTRRSLGLQTIGAWLRRAGSRRGQSTSRTRVPLGRFATPCAAIDRGRPAPDNACPRLVQDRTARCDAPRSPTPHRNPGWVVPGPPDSIAWEKPRRTATHGEVCLCDRRSHLLPRQGHHRRQRRPPAQGAGPQGLASSSSTRTSTWTRGRCRRTSTARCSSPTTAPRRTWTSATTSGSSTRT